MDAKMSDEKSDKLDASKPEDWKRRFKDSLNAMVDSLPEDLSSIATEMNSPKVSEPSLEEFYCALIALEASTRKNVQKTNAALDLVAKNLRGLQVQISALDEQNAKNTRNDYESLISLNGQFLRMLESLKLHPSPLPLGLSHKWEQAWSDLSRGVEILHRSIINILDECGITIETPAIGSIFNPQTMEAIQVKSTGAGDKDAVVVAIIEPAYYKNNVLIRNARVYVEK
jgi:hypothetical protein